MVDVSIVTLTLNHLELTRRLIESVEARAGAIPYELIVVDSGSTDGTREYLRDHGGITTVDAEGWPFVFNRNLNRGVDRARGEIVICANNDAEILTDDFLEPIVRALRDNPSIGVLGVELGEPPPTDGDNGEPRPVFLSGYTVGFFFAMRRAVWKEIGGLSELYNGYGCEEADLSVRLLRAGYRTAYLKGVFCRHEAGATFSQGHISPEGCEKNAAVFEKIHGYDLNFREGVDFWINLDSYLEWVFDHEWRRKTTRLELRRGCPNPTKPPRDHVVIDLEPGPRVDIAHDVTEGIPYPDSSVDEIRADHLLEHLADPIHFMNEVYRVLKPSGLLHARVPSTDGRAAWVDPGHKTFWNECSWAYYCEESGIDRAYQERIGLTAHLRIDHMSTIEVGGFPYTTARLRAAK